MAFPSTTLLDDFKRTENPLSNGGKWSKLNWASQIGKCFSATFGWVSTTGSTGEVESEASGAFWNVAAFEEPAVSVKLYWEAGANYAALWACTSGAGTKNGYRLKITRGTSAGLMVMTLEKWVEGVRSELNKAEVAVETLSHTTAVGLTVAGGKVKGWYGLTEAALAVQVEATDATFVTGKVGLENSKTAQDGTVEFKAGSQASPHSHTLAASQAQSISAPTRPLTRSLTASQPQIAKAAHDVAASRTASQAQSAALAEVAGRAQGLSASQGQSATAVHALGPTRKASQPQTAAVAHNLTRTLTGSQSQAPTLGGHSHALTQSQSTSVARSEQAARLLTTTQTTSASLSGGLFSGPFPSTELLDDLKRTENPLSNGGKWSKLNWATAVGRTYNAFFGWIAVGGTPPEENPSGAYWNVNAFEEPAVSVRMYIEADASYHALWACTTGEGTKNGYRLAVKFTEGGHVTLTLEKWVAGVRTELAKVEIPIAAESEATAYGLTVSEGKVRGWYGDTEGELKVKLEAADSTFTTGKVGIEGIGNESDGLTEFRAGSAVPSHDHTLTASQPQTAKVAHSVTTTRKASQTQGASIEGLGPHQHSQTVTQPISAKLAKALKRTLTITQPTTALVHIPTVTPITGDGEARAEGTGILTSPSQPLEGFGEARALGVGFLTYAAPPSTPPTFDDLWYYGAAAFKREMSGVGVATANGDSVLAT